MDIFAEINALNFPPDQYVVVGGAVLAAHGIREAHDIDIVVKPELFERCKSEGWELHPWTRRGKESRPWLKREAVDLYIEFSHHPENLSAAQLLREAEMIQGIPFVTLRNMIEYKREYGRPKDFEDIARIEQYLAL